MSYTKIQFIHEGVSVKLKKLQTKKWINEVCNLYGYSIKSLSYIFCNDAYLLDMNIKHLNHDTLTDIITFDLKDDFRKKEIEGDIYISADRVKENAQSNKVSVENETLRVVIHGVLHLCGFKDKSKEEKKEMRLNEDLAIQKFYAMFHVE